MHQTSVKIALAQPRLHKVSTDIMPHECGILP